MRNKKYTKVISAIIAVVTMVCATTVNSSALCLNDIISNNSIITLIQCFRTGKCNLQDLLNNNSVYTNGNCNVAPTPAEIVTPTTPVADTTTDVQTVLDLTNKERKSTGLDALTLSDELCKVANIRAKEIVKSFSHTRPNGTSCFTAFNENGVTYRNAGENIAYGQKTATIVMNAWMNSAGHRANILNKNFGKIGIACYNFNGVKYWVQLFTN